MPDLGPGFNQLSAAEKDAVNHCVAALTKLHPDAATDLSVNSAYGSVTLNVKAPVGKEMTVQNDMMGPVTDLMLATGILIVLLVTRKD